MGQSVGHREKAGDGTDIPNIVIAETVITKKLMIRLAEIFGCSRQLDSKGDHGLLSVIKIRFGWVNS